MILASSLEGAAISKLWLKEWKYFLINGFWVYKEYCDTSNFMVCKFEQVLGKQICVLIMSLEHLKG